MENLELIVKGLGEETALQVKNSLSEFILKANEWREQIDSLVIESVNDTAKMKIAREARLFLKNNRLDAKRLTDMKRDEVKAKKLQFDLEDKAWLKGFQLVEEVCKSLEEKALEKEKYAEKVEAERKEKLRQDRWNQIERYVEIEPFGLGEMPEATFKALLTGAKSQYEERVEAERKAEEERLEKERLEKLYNQRRYETSRLIDFIEDYDSVEWHLLSEEEYNHIVTTAVDKRSEHEAEQQRIREESERYVIEAKKAMKEAEKARKEVEEINKKVEKERIQAQRQKEAELAKIQAELEIERKKEQLRIQREKEAEEERKKAERESLLAPDKDKIFAYIKNVNPLIPDLSSTSSKEVFKEISEKLEGWRGWAIKTAKDKL
jgi:hypothetical protein